MSAGFGCMHEVCVCGMGGVGMQRIILVPMHLTGVHGMVPTDAERSDWFKGVTMMTAINMVPRLHTAFIKCSHI